MRMDKMAVNLLLFSEFIRAHQCDPWLKIRIEFEGRKTADPWMRD